jgi:hypothetical protein
VGRGISAGNKGLKKTYAPLRIDGDRIYGAGGGSVYAINRRTGAQLWKSDRISDFAGLLKARDNAIVAQLEVVGGKIFSRYGGNFSDGKTAMLKEPLGVVVLDPADGKSLYHFDKAKEGITNLVVLPETNSVVFADGANVYGIDTAAATPAEAFKMPIEFKKKMGMARRGENRPRRARRRDRSRERRGVRQQGPARRAGGGAASTNGTRGRAGQAAPPRASIRRTKTSAWSLFYAAPSDAFANIAMFAVTAAAAVYGNGQAAASGGFGSSGYSSGVNTIHSNLDRYNKLHRANSRSAPAASKSSVAYSYVLTKVEKDIGIVGVNLASGETDRRTRVEGKRARTTRSTSR